jgi:hypothetical protein
VYRPEPSHPDQLCKPACILAVNAQIAALPSVDGISACSDLDGGRGGDGGRTRNRMSVDTIEDIAVLGALLVFSSLSLAVIVLMY